MLALLSSGAVFAASSTNESFQIDSRFVVEDVRLQGLQRVSAGTVFNLSLIHI